jgi:hypothetical protein
VINCWLVVALPMRATGTLFCTTTVSAGESNPIPANPAPVSVGVGNRYQ